MTSGMSLRLELFVTDIERAVSFYRDALGFEIVRADPGYTSIRRGSVTLGLGPVAKLSDSAGYFTRTRLAQERGLGIEIVLEVEDVAESLAGVEASGYPVFEPLQVRPWGLTDFRLIDPDGYYLRVTSRSPGQ
jgi:predicted enzyme related to lactoylglutathione lyase